MRLYNNAQRWVMAVWCDANVPMYRIEVYYNYAHCTRANTCSGYYRMICTTWNMPVVCHCGPLPTFGADIGHAEPNISIFIFIPGKFECKIQFTSIIALEAIFTREICSTVHISICWPPPQSFRSIKDVFRQFVVSGFIIADVQPQNALFRCNGNWNTSFL